MEKRLFENKWLPDLIGNIVDKIRSNSIVPIIGPNVFFVEEGDRRLSAQEFIVRTLLESYFPQEKDSLDLYLNGFHGMTKLRKLFAGENLNLNNCLDKFFKSDDFKKIKIDEDVLMLLQRGKFPLILTTCIFRGILDSKDIWGNDKYHVVTYLKEKNSTCDVRLNEERDKIKDPTIFHLFGYVTPSPGDCAINENDFLAYLHCILDSNTGPKDLKYYLNKKYLLALGCDIPDWTFRLLFYSLKAKEGNLLDSEGSKNNFVGGALDTHLDENLAEFLSDIKYFSENRVNEFLRDINSQLSTIHRPSVFLSLNNEEYEKIGKQIKAILDPDFEVWIFNEDKDYRYWEKIGERLNSCNYVITIITDKTLIKISLGKKTDELTYDKEPGIITEWRICHERCKKQIFPILYDVKIEDFKDSIEKSSRDYLNDIFFPPGIGNEALCVSSINDISIDKIRKHFNI